MPPTIECEELKMDYLVTYEDESGLQHHGILGQKWGHRQGPPYPLDSENHSASEKKSGWRKSLDKESLEVNDKGLSYSKTSQHQIRENRDGSFTVPKNFTFNRVGKSSMDVNQSGGLYVSHGKEDIARYVKALGPTFLGRLMGTAGEAVQHINVKQELKMPSDKEVNRGIAEAFLKNKNLMESFNESIYSMAYGKNITSSDFKKMYDDPSSGDSRKLAYAVSAMFGDGNYASETKNIYDHFRGKGYDALPDAHDRMTGTSKTAMIVINPNKVEVSSYTPLTKESIKETKKFLKNVEKLPIDKLLK